MDKNCFDVICNLICDNEKVQKNFKCEKEKDTLSLISNSCSYKIIYDVVKKQILLNFIDTQSNITKNLSSWFLDNETAVQKDINMIAKDFIETIVGKERNNKKQVKKKINSSDESNITGLFLANRIVNIFPEIRGEIQLEKENNFEFRSATFARKHILPKIQELIISGKEKAKLTKLAKLLSELYQNGTLDARSIITMGILNGIEGEKAINVFRPLLSLELQKAWDAALKYKGKIVKPEKPKKTMLSKALEMQKNTRS